jgi:hypothetical protein
LRERQFRHTTDIAAPFSPPAAFRRFRRFLRQILSSIFTADVFARLQLSLPPYFRLLIFSFASFLRFRFRQPLMIHYFRYAIADYADYATAAVSIYRYDAPCQPQAVHFAPLPPD